MQLDVVAARQFIVRVAARHHLNGVAIHAWRRRVGHRETIDRPRTRHPCKMTLTGELTHAQVGDSDVRMKHSLPSTPPLDGLRAVLAASQAGSFNVAADSLGLTHGAVSRRVAGVEAWLGTAIFER